MKKEIKAYESPVVEVMNVQIEKGFAASSGTIEDGITTPDWDGGNTDGWEIN